MATGVEVLHVERRSATVVWITENPVRGKVFFRRAAGSNQAMVATESLSKSYRHQVKLTNLKPGTRYTYWIESPDRRFQFQTQPEKTTPFSFLIINGHDKKRIEKLVMTEIPDFILDVGMPGATEDPYQRIRPYLPVFDRHGIQSPFLNNRKSGQPAKDDLWTLSWGGVQLLVVKKMATPAVLSGLPNSMLTGVVIAGENFSMDKSENDLKSNITRSAFHDALLAHNRRHPDRPLSFVVVLSKHFWHQRIGDLAYLGIPVNRIGEDVFPVRMDMDVQSASAVLLNSGESIALKETPLKERITCDDCRKLADQGAYHAAIDAYETFIEHHAGHFQIDDAYFAVAELYDEKLFEFKSALDWYGRLIKSYEDSALVPLARQRVKHLSAYSDFGFEPLARFERIKKSEYARKKDQPGEMEDILDKARQIVTDFPKAAIAPEIQHWLGVQYRSIDIQQSVAAFERLRQNYPQAPEASGARLDIGDTYYQAGRYRLAKSAYQAALMDQPHLSRTIESQINRCSRNIRRVWLSVSAVILLGMVSIISLVFKPLGMSVKLFSRGLMILVVLLAVNLLAAWLIHEQFMSVAEMMGIVSGLSAAAVWGGLVGVTLSNKFFFHSPFSERISVGFLPGFCGAGLGLLIFAAGGYLSIYYINEHYLILLNL